MKVLFIDDEIELAASVKDLLEDIGHEVICSNSVTDALENLEIGNLPDLIIIDYHMPVKNGLELMREGRHLIRDIPTYLLTGHINSKEAQEAKELGFQDVFTKPMPMEVLLNLLEQKYFSLAPEKNSGIIEE